MPDMAYGVSAYSRDRGNLPELPLVNLFVEQADSEASPVLQSRPGLVQEQTLGTGPIRATVMRDGVLGGERITVSGDTVFIGSTDIGTIAGDGPVSIATSELEAVISAGEGIYLTDGATLTAITFPDSADVAAVTFLAGHFIAVRKGTNKFYWSAALDGSSWDGLDFASAENEPDELRDVAITNDVLVFLGSETVEFWPRTGDPDLPFAPQQGMVYDKGVIATGCTVAFDNGFAWLSGNGCVYRSGNVPERVSTHWIEAKAGVASTRAMFRIDLEGHEFAILRLSNGTFAYDAATRQWCEFSTWQSAGWRVASAGAGLLGDGLTGGLFRFDGHADLGGVMERRFRAGLPMKGGAVAVVNTGLRLNVGHAPSLTGDYAEPAVECRISRDAGQTWGVWRRTSMGRQGEYRRRVEWRRWGVADEPGVLFEFRCTDPVPFRVSGATVNERGGGRSR